MRYMKRKYVFFLTISIPISYFFYFLNSSYVQSNSFQTEKTVNNVDLNFIANIDQNGKLNNDCFAFFITNKYSITTIDCAHDSLTTIKKLDNPLEGNDYYKKGSNGLLLNSVIKPATRTIVVPRTKDSLIGAVAKSADIDLVEWVNTWVASVVAAP